MSGRQRISNRNELEGGPSPAVRKALRDFPASGLSHYRDGYYGSDLAAAIAKRCRVPVERIILSYGLEDFLPMALAELGAKRPVMVVNDIHYADYDTIARKKGMRIVTFALRKRATAFSFDIDDCLRTVRMARPSLLIITSPNNPTGNAIAPRDFSRIMRSVPRRTTVFLDEAYIGFQRGYRAAFFLGMVRRYPNLALLRTFSKSHGLAGLRLGYVVCGRDIRRRLRNGGRILGFSRVHEALGLAALNDRGNDLNIRRVQFDRDRFVSQINQLNRFVAFRSAANFVMLECATAALHRVLWRTHLRHASAVMMKPYGGRFFRVTIGRTADTRALLGQLRSLDSRRR